MINENDEVQRKNINLLIEGFWYEDLPPVFDIDEIRPAIFSELKKIDLDECKDFERGIEGYIEKFKNVQSPGYIYNDGIEPITFFEFKSNDSLREMQIPNIKYYCSFIFNTISAYDDLFIKLYKDDNLKKYVENSNSYLLLNELFYVHKLYNGEEEVLMGDTFVVKNNKTTGQLALRENSFRYQTKQASKLYTVKVDIESFFPNIYTHYLDRIKNQKPYEMMTSCDKYFSFLDYYNMKINNDQTKGIPAGVFSSVVSAELLMLCIDSDIKESIGDDIEYIRYVDDMTFFSDSKEAIYEKLPLVQQILNKYRLRINSSKTDSKKGIYNISYVDIYELKKRFAFMDFECDDVVDFDIDAFYNLKEYIANRYDLGEKTEIKAILTLIKSAITKDKIAFSQIENIKIEQYLAAYMLQLACIEPVFASRCYRVIIALLDKCDELDICNCILEELKRKNEYVNTSYHDTVLQIWHYYVLSVYDSNIKIKDIIYTFGSTHINPIMLSCFIKKGDNQNKDIFNYIKCVYSEVENRQGEADYWKKSVMLSKWWLPLVIIYIKDGKDYDKFYSSNHFSEFFKNMKHDEPEIDMYDAYYDTWI